MKEETLPPPIWVDQPASFRAMVDHLRGEPALAIDTESNSLYVYREQVCLIQVSVPGSDYLVDPLALGDISGLGPLLQDASVLKVLHGAEYDVSVLHRDFGFILVNLFDTMWASRILGWPAHGLAALLEEHFGVHLNKKFQRANWGLRPLPSAQLDYARLDTHYLLPLYEIQREELDVQGRWPQARHRFSRLVKTRWEPKEFDPQGFWRLSGVRQLDDEGRGVLRELYLFRERRAQLENRPPFRIMSKRALVAISDQRPGSWKGLQQIRGVSYRMAKRYGQELLSAIRSGAQSPIPWEKRPRQEHGRRRNGPPSPAVQARFEALRAWRNATAAARGVEPDVVLTNQYLWAIAQRNPRRKEDLLGDGLLVRWQVDEYGEQLLAILNTAS